MHACRHVKISWLHYFNRYGQCVPYTGGNSCDVFYIIGIDKVFIPNGRARDDIDKINSFAEQAKVIVENIQEPCRYVDRAT